MVYEVEKIFSHQSYASSNQLLFGGILDWLVQEYMFMSLIKL